MDEVAAHECSGSAVAEILRRVSLPLTCGSHISTRRAFFHSSMNLARGGVGGINKILTLPASDCGEIALGRQQSRNGGD